MLRTVSSIDEFISVNGLKPIFIDEPILYTVLTNGYDKLPSFDFSMKLIVFTDSPWDDEALRFVQISCYYKNPRTTNRLIKLRPDLFFKGGHKSLYFDSNIRWLKDPAYLLSMEGSFVLWKHEKRDCVYDEIKVCKKWAKDSIVNLNRHYDFLTHEGVENNQGLYFGGVLVRDHGKIQSLSKDWFEQYEKFSKRDQISLAWLVWRNPELFVAFEYDLLNEFIERQMHSKEVHYTADKGLHSRIIRLIETLIKLRRKVVKSLR